MVALAVGLMERWVIRVKGVLLGATCKDGTSCRLRSRVENHDWGRQDDSSQVIEGMGDGEEGERKKNRKEQRQRLRVGDMLEPQAAAAILVAEHVPVEPVCTLTSDVPRGSLKTEAAVLREVHLGKTK